jgi:hypothetical protein
MSRLDDELRLAFRRQEPPAGFAERVMERVAARPAPKPKWWETLASLFQPPRIRWVAIGVAASLVVVIGLLQYAASEKTTARKDDAQADASSPPEPARPPAFNPPAPTGPPPPKRAPRPKRIVRPPVDRMHLAQKNKDQEDQQKIEGEKAKQKVMLALHIASATLNEAQKIIRED